MRSLLFVPGDDEKKLAKARASDADALIFDLEDSVAAENKIAARSVTLAALAEPTKAMRFVRLNPFDTGLLPGDLAATLDGQPDGFVLPKASGAEIVGEVAATDAANNTRSWNRFSS